jgi:hypothetical protein
MCDSEGFGYTFAIFYKGSEAKHRAKSVVHFTGCSDMCHAMLKAKEFADANPEITVGAGVCGIHSTTP